MMNNLANKSQYFSRIYHVKWHSCDKVYSCSPVSFTGTVKFAFSFSNIACFINPQVQAATPTSRGYMLLLCFLFM